MPNIYVEIVLSLIKIISTVMLVKQFGFILGILISVMCSKVYHYVICFIFKIEKVDSADLFFIGLEQKDRFNIMGYTIFDNFDVDKMKELVTQNLIRKLTKMRMKLVYKFFNYYWKEIPHCQAEKKVIIATHLGTEEDLLNYVKAEMNRPIDIFTQLPYEVHLIPFGEKKGALFFKFDHCFSDGLGSMSLMLCLASNYDLSIFPKIMQRATKTFNLDSIIEKVLGVVLFPVYIIYMTIKVLRRGKTPSPFKKDHADLTGKTKFAISKHYHMKDFDKIRKNYQVSFNDVIISVISLAIKRLCQENKEYSKLEKVKMFIPIGNKSIPKGIGNIQLDNEAIGLFSDMELIEDFKRCRDVSKGISNQIKLKGLKTTFKLMRVISGEFFAPSLINLTFVSSMDLCVTNVPGPTKELLYGDAILTSMVPLISAGKGVCFIPIISYKDSFRFAFSIDQAIDIDPDNFVHLIDEIIRELKTKTE